jgi:branched-chain amino acid transport system substrate-binding protein
MPILTQDKVFSLQVDVSDQTIDPATHPYAFSLATSSEDFALEVAATTKAHYPNAKKIGMIIGNDVNGASLLKGEKPAFEKEGYSVSVEQYDPSTTINMVPQLEALRATNPQVLLASGFGAAAGYILKARSQIGWNIPVVGDAAFSSNPLTSIASASALKGVDVLSSTPQVYKPLSTQSAAFKMLYKAVAPKNGAFAVTFLLYEFGWDEIMVAQAAAKQAGSFGTAPMTQAMEHLKDTNNPMYLLGTYQYSATSHTPIRSLSEATLASPYTKNGQSLPFGQS